MRNCSPAGKKKKKRNEKRTAIREKGAIYTSPLARSNIPCWGGKGAYVRTHVHTNVAIVRQPERSGETKKKEGEKLRAMREEGRSRH